MWWREVLLTLGVLCLLELPTATSLPLVSSGGARTTHFSRLSFTRDGGFVSSMELRRHNGETVHCKIIDHFIYWRLYCDSVLTRQEEEAIGVHLNRYEEQGPGDERYTYDYDYGAPTGESQEVSELDEIDLTENSRDDEVDMTNNENEPQDEHYTDDELHDENEHSMAEENQWNNQRNDDNYYYEDYWYNYFDDPDPIKNKIGNSVDETTLKVGLTNKDDELQDKNEHTADGENQENGVNDDEVLNTYETNDDKSMVIENDAEGSAYDETDQDGLIKEVGIAEAKDNMSDNTALTEQEDIIPSADTEERTKGTVNDEQEGLVKEVSTVETNENIPDNTAFTGQDDNTLKADGEESQNSDLNVRSLREFLKLMCSIEEDKSIYLFSFCNDYLNE